MKRILLAILAALALAAPVASAQAAFQCTIASGAYSVVSDPIGPQFGTVAVPPTFRLFDNGVQVASGNMVQSSSISLANVPCVPAEAAYNPGAAGSWAIRTSTGALVVGSTHTYTAIVTNTTVTPNIDSPLGPVLTITVVAVLPVAPPAPTLSIRP